MTIKTTAKQTLSVWGLAAATLLASPSAHAADKDVRVMLDWLVQGTHAPFFVAKDKGYFKSESLNPKIDAGKGGTNTAVSVAGGAYEFGYVDLVTMIKFNAQNPTKPLVNVYMSFDETPLAVITLKSKGITSPKDLDGKKIAGGPGTATHDTISILMKAADAQSAKINWVAAAPQLFGALLKKGDVDGIGGFTNSQIPMVYSMGYKLDEIQAIRYSDFGTGLYGLGLVTTKDYADKNPDIVKGMVKALNKGMIDTIRDPDAALALMKANDPLMKVDVEKVRLNIALGHTYNDHTKKSGLSSVDPARVQKNIDAVVAAYQLKSAPTPADVWSDAYLPPASERMVGK